MDKNDRAILHDLARRVAEIAHDSVNEERRRLWYKHAAFEGERPMVLSEVWGIMPIPELRCRSEEARGHEAGLLHTITRFETVRDDHVVMPYLTCNWNVGAGNYGVQPKYERTTNEGQLASCRWEGPIKDVDKDFGKLRPREFSVDRAGALKYKAYLEELYDGILPVHIRGGYWWTLGMTGVAINFLGLEGFMMAMVDQPEGLHRIMAFLRDDHIRFAEWLEAENLLSLNNENDYIGSGSEGFTHELPQRDLKKGDPVRLKDLWMLSESQETVCVSPRMFAEFVFPYQRAVIEKFGLCYYGCCEPVHARWDCLRQLPNLRRVSVSPWCDEELMAAECGNRITFSRKPNPTLISKPNFDEDEIRADIRGTLKAAKGCALEIVMKDVHTLCGEPRRLSRWVEIAREEIDRFGG